MLNAMRSRDDHCLALLRLISHSCSRHEYDVLSDWVSRELNMLADFLSKLHATQETHEQTPGEPTVTRDFPLLVHHVATGKVYSCRVTLPYGIGRTNASTPTPHGLLTSTQLMGSV